MTTAYPLAWPGGFPRAKLRERGQFKTSLEGALKNVEGSLRLFAKDSGKNLTGVVMSSNYTLGVRSPADPGVAVYFTWDGIQICIPVDRYDSIASNLQAIHHIIEARRVELRHGTLALVRATFQGFAVLPAPGPAWHVTLGVAENAPIAEAERAYREKAKRLHPDSPDGSHAAMAELNAAIATARQRQEGGQ
jgi:hypothetical protein